MIRIYTKPGCEDCRQALELLQGTDVAYEEVSIQGDAVRSDIANLGWQGHAPFVVLTVEEPSREVLVDIISVEQERLLTERSRRR